MKGGSGVWGPVPMPANSQVTEADAKALAAWITELK
ncbi:c-type cytochrome [Sphingomonas sp. NCPPB 2930]